mgnify:CR=1 FL=1
MDADALSLSPISRFKNTSVVRLNGSLLSGCEILWRKQNQHDINLIQAPANKQTWYLDATATGHQRSGLVTGLCYKASMSPSLRSSARIKHFDVWQNCSVPHWLALAVTVETRLSLVNTWHDYCNMEIEADIWATLVDMWLFLFTSCSELWAQQTHIWHRASGTGHSAVQRWFCNLHWTDHFYS